MEISNLGFLYLMIGWCLCTCFHQLGSMEASLMTIGLGTNLQVYKNIIRNNFTDFFYHRFWTIQLSFQFLVIQAVSDMNLLSWHGPQIKLVIDWPLP